MNTVQINTLLRSDPIARNYFRGTYACDTVPDPKTFPSSYVVNTEPAIKQGAHWVGLYIQANGTGYYFDSYGRNPNQRLQNYLNRVCPNYTQSHQRIQGVLASTCAHYCIYFCLMVSRGYTLAEILKKFDPYDAASNDVTITKYINSTFDTRFPTYDTQLLSQYLVDIAKKTERF